MNHGSTAHRARKRFGQNFLHDPVIIQRIIQAVGPQAGQNLVEIGPGLGALTVPLLKACGRLQVIELDRDIIPKLQALTHGLGELIVHNQDALKFDFSCLAPADQPLRLIGNLPYNISTPLLFHLLSQSAIVRDMHFMLQREVVDRIVAKPGNKQYGRLSVGMALRADCEPLFTVGPGAFNPAPKVESAVLRITPDPNRLRPRNQQHFDQLVTAAFSARRKTLSNALRKLLAREEITGLGIDPGLRPEQISPDDYRRLSDGFTRMQSGND